MVWLRHKRTIELSQCCRLSHPTAISLLTSKANTQFVKGVMVPILMTKQNEQVTQAKCGCLL